MQAHQPCKTLHTPCEYRNKAERVFYFHGVALDLTNICAYAPCVNGVSRASQMMSKIKYMQAHQPCKTLHTPCEYRNKAERVFYFHGVVLDLTNICAYAPCVNGMSRASQMMSKIKY